jgi:hypothetical protein
VKESEREEQTNQNKKDLHFSISNNDDAYLHTLVTFFGIDHYHDFLFETLRD